MSASAAGRAAQGAVKENRLPRRSSREPFRYMIRLLTVIGARPQIIKAAALSRAISGEFSGVVEEHILHTGQHYDDNMSRVFFNELGIPAPYRNLNVGSAPHGVQTAEMIVGIEKALSEGDFDGVVVYGDTNSTLAGAVAAAKMNVPIYHVEAGLRSFNMSMPEEINRRVCDTLSSILFAPTDSAVENLAREGCADDVRTAFAGGRKRVVIKSGDVMYDNAIYYGEKAERESNVLRDNRLENRQYILATVHRESNTDRPENLNGIFRAMADIAGRDGISIVLPLHPRTRKMMETALDRELRRRIGASRMKIIEPVSYLDMVMLEKHARMVMTDSGGVQKEAFFYGKPCVILREETEWTEIVSHGAGILTGADYDRIMDAHRRCMDIDVTFPPLYGDGHAAEKIVRAIVEYSGQEERR